MKRILSFAFLFFTTFICQAQPGQSIDFVATTWDEAVVKAGKTEKQIFLYAQTKSCHFCRQMEKETFVNPGVIDYYNANFISYKIDIGDGGVGEALSKQYAIVGFPTYLYFDPNGKKLHQSSGFKPADAFIQDGKNASDPDKALFSMLAKYDQGQKSPEMLFDLSNALGYYMSDDSPKDKVTEEYLATQSAAELSSEKNLRFIFGNYQDFSATSTQYLLKNQARFVPVFGKADVDRRAQRIVTKTASDAGQNNDPALLADLQKVVSTNFADTGKVMPLTRIYYYSGKQDWLNYAKSTLQYSNTVGASDWQTLYETGAYLKHFAEDKETLKIGVQIMDKVLKLHKNYGHLCIYARLQSKIGNKTLALKAAREAETVAKNENEDGDEAREMIAELGAAKK